MRFSYRKTERGPASFFHDALFLDDNGQLIFALRVSENTADAWTAGIQKMGARSNPYYKNLLDSAEDLPKCTYEDMDALITLWEIVFALWSSLGDKRDGGAGKTMIECLRKWFYFDAEYNQAANTCKYFVSVGGETFRRHHSLAKNQSALTGIPATLFSYDIAALQKQNLENLNSLLQNYERLLEVSTIYWKNEPEHKKFVFHSFANFSKALIEYLEKNDGLSISTKIINTILAVVVKDENEPLDNQQAYLRKILESKEDEQVKYERLDDIAKDVHDDVRDARGAETRLISILGAISAYYLRQYDFEHALYFWKLLDKRDGLLQQILNFYGAPTKYVFVAFVGMGCATALTWFHSYYLSNPIIEKIISDAILAFLLPVLLIIPVTAIFVFRCFFVVKQGPEYIELFFPRLLGAIIVGLSVLLFQDTSWKFGLQLDWTNLILIYLLIYPLALLYIFINVHKELRYLPHHNNLSGEKEISPMKRSISVSLKVFSIGLLESFFAVLLTSSIFYKGVFTDCDLQNWVQKGWVITWEIKGVISLGFFPMLVFLWTGLSLLIGAFAQLLWQDRQITST
jgi:hypothetical protein